MTDETNHPLPVPGNEAECIEALKALNERETDLAAREAALADVLAYHPADERDRVIGDALREDAPVTPSVEAGMGPGAGPVDPADASSISRGSKRRR
jgi:hypothetical protein